MRATHRDIEPLNILSTGLTIFCFLFLLLCVATLLSSHLFLCYCLIVCFLAAKLEHKLSDFGLARFLPQSDSIKMTKGCGSPLYMAPEVQTGNYTEKADVYSLGVTVYEMMNLHTFPPPGLNILNLAQLKFDKNTNYSKELNDLVLSMVGKDPTQRPTMADVYRTAIDSFSEEWNSEADDHNKRISVLKTKEQMLKQLVTRRS